MKQADIEAAERLAHGVIERVATRREQRAYKLLDPSGELARRALAKAAEAESVLRICDEARRAL